GEGDPDAARGGGGIGLVGAGGGLVDEHQHHGAVFGDLGDGGADDGGVGGHRLLLGGGRHHLLGELAVVGEEVAGEVLPGRCQVRVDGIGGVGEQGDGAGGGGLGGAARGRVVDPAVGAILGGPQRHRQHRGRDGQRRQQREAAFGAHHSRRPPRGPCEDTRGGHGTNSTFDILIVSPSLVTVTLSRHALGSCRAPAELVTWEVAATSTTAESSVIDSTAAACTVPAVATCDCSMTAVKSSARPAKSSRNAPVEWSSTRCTS